MIPERILYTDGHEVTVTDSLFIVKKSFYQLKGITWHGLLTIYPAWLTPFLALMLSVALMMLAILHWIPETYIQPFAFSSVVVSEKALALGSGIVATIAAALMLVLRKERYAIRIATAEGEKNVVVSRKKEYINQIFMALNQAFLHQLKGRHKK